MILNKRNPETLETISSLIGDGGVAILPCDTIYGLCAAYDIGEKALMDLKGRDSRKPFLVLATIAQAKQLCTEIPQDILEAWPAALTVILNRKEGGTIAIRVPNDAFLQRQHSRRTLAPQPERHMQAFRIPCRCRRPRRRDAGKGPVDTHRRDG